MKSERRHELEQNLLAKWLASKSEQIKPLLNYILIGVVGVIILWAVYQVWTRDSRQVSEEAAKQLVASSFSSDIRETQKAVDVAGDTPAGLLARQRLARQQLVRGNELWMTNRDEAQRNLNQAIENFDRIAGRTKDVMTKQYVAFHTALAYESLTNIDKAKKDYEQIVKDWPDSAYGKKAKERLEALNKPGAQEFYLWYREAKFEASNKSFGDFKPSEVLNPPDKKDDGKSPDPLPLPDAAKAPADSAKPDDKAKPADSPKPADTKPTDKGKTSGPNLKPPVTTDKPVDAAKPASPAKPVDAAKPVDKPVPKS